MLRILGPGLLFAGAAIGVSHLVMATKAGAIYGFGLVWAVLLVNLLKYPFFEFGPRYAAATGESLIEGYRKMGWWAVAVVIFITVGTMFTIQAAVTVVTAGVAAAMLPYNIDSVTWSAIILGICLLILTLGHYSFLDKFIKYVILVLSVSTLVAVAFAWQHPAAKYPEFETQFVWNAGGITFLIALMGWMPAPLDLSVWNSIWALEKKQQLGGLQMKQSLLDFNVGYVGTVILAFCFLSLGAFQMYGTGTELPTRGGAFVNQLIELYTQSLGSWSRPLILAAAFTTMFSTTLTCLDAFPRVLGRIVLLFAHPDSRKDNSPNMPENNIKRTNYWIWILLVAIGALALLEFLGGQMSMMVKIATILSFIPTPLFALLNYRLVTSQHMPKEHQPAMLLKLLSWVGLIFLTGFVGLYLFTLLNSFP